MQRFEVWRSWGCVFCLCDREWRNVTPQLFTQFKSLGLNFLEGRTLCEKEDLVVVVANVVSNDGRRLILELLLRDALFCPHRSYIVGIRVQHQPTSRSKTRSFFSHNIQSRKP